MFSGRLESGVGRDRCRNKGRRLTRRVRPWSSKIRPSSSLSTNRRNRSRARRLDNLSGRPRRDLFRLETGQIFSCYFYVRLAVYRFRSLFQASEEQDLFLTVTGRRTREPTLFFPVTREKQGEPPIRERRRPIENRAFRGGRTRQRRRDARRWLVMVQRRTRFEPIASRSGGSLSRPPYVRPTAKRPSLPRNAVKRTPN